MSAQQLEPHKQYIGEEEEEEVEEMNRFIEKYWPCVELVTINLFLFFFFIQTTIIPRGKSTGLTNLSSG